MDNHGISPEILRELIDYNPETGDMVWKPRDIRHFTDHGGRQEWVMKCWNSRLAGKPALNCVSATGNKHGAIFASPVLAHRVAWAIHYGKYPDQFIDHINGVRGDNRITNLRDVSKELNCKNTKRRKDNRSGYPGVYKYKNRYIAHIRINGKLEVIGRFDSALDAHNFREIEKLKYGYHPNHGRE